MLSEYANEETKTAYQELLWKGETWFAFSSPQISYVSQTVGRNKIQFSYILADNGIIVQSDVYTIDEILGQFGESTSCSKANYNTINDLIMNNIITEFKKVKFLPPPQQVPETRGYSTLDSAIKSVYGRSYNSKNIGRASKSDNGDYYTVNCTEAQTITKGKVESQWFAKKVALSAIVSFAIGGGWGWIAATRTLIGSVVGLVVIDGVQSTKSSFTAKRVNVKSVRTRLVTVNGYSGTQYWSGWNRNMYFFKGNSDWTHDIDSHGKVKHPDYDNISRLMEKGFQNFVDYVL